MSSEPDDRREPDKPLPLGVSSEPRNREPASRFIKERIYRDLAGLGVFLGLFYAVVYFAGRLSGDADGADVNVSQMTSARVQADRALRNANHTEAILHLTQMIDTDPYNSHAHMLLVKSYLNDFAKTQARIRKAEKTPGRSKEIEAMRERMAEYETKALASIEQCCQSARYRSDGLLELAKLHGTKRDRERTLETLRDLQGEANDVRHGLEHITEFQFLSDEPEFQKMVERDRAHKHYRGRNRRR